MNEKLVIYHGNCADGFTAAWCFFNKFKNENILFHKGVYGETPPDVTNKDVYLVDFSYDRKTVIEMIGKANRVVLIDHHISAIKDLDNVNGLEYYTSLDHSGAKLAWKYLYGGEKPPLLLEYIEDRDLFRNQLPNSKEISNYVFSFEYSFDNWDLLMSKTEEDFENILLEAKAISRRYNKDCKELAHRLKTRMIIDGHDVPVANLPYIYTTDIATVLAENELFAASYYITETHVEFGLRSTESGLDVSEIAKKFGGGGHKRASGFRIPLEQFVRHLKENKTIPITN